MWYIYIIYLHILLIFNIANTSFFNIVSDKTLIIPLIGVHTLMPAEVYCYVTNYDIWRSYREHIQIIFNIGTPYRSPNNNKMYCTKFVLKI